MSELSLCFRFRVISRLLISLQPEFSGAFFQVFQNEWEPCAHNGDHTFMNALTYTHTHARTHGHTHTHTHKHTHTHIQSHGQTDRQTHHPPCTQMPTRHIPTHVDERIEKSRVDICNLALNLKLSNNTTSLLQFISIVLLPPSAAEVTVKHEQRANLAVSHVIVTAARIV